jgi:lysylphosphatidylglycerol synthetase-like protein (DUF2156 family)
MSDLLATHLVVGGSIIVCCAIALRLHFFEKALRRFEFEREHISFLNAVLWFVIAGLSFIILRDIWRNLSA